MMGKIEVLDKNLLDKLLEGIEKPGRYIGREYNTKSKGLIPGAMNNEIVFLALAFPDIYEVGISNLGLQILYHIINRNPEFSAERVFSPWVDFEKKIRDMGVRLFSLENRIFLDCFDIIGFSVQHELLYSNILNMMDMGGIKLYSRQRGNHSPLVMAGGPSIANPQPLSDFMDFFVIGDGEETALEIMKKVAIYKKDRKDKTWLLKKISRFDGVYIPGFYKFSYFPDGRIKEINPHKKIKKAVIKNLDFYEIIQDPVIPNIKAIHDRFTVEIMRGCSRGCRFCQAGFIYRPVRQRRADLVLEQSTRGLSDTGYDEISFLSLSSSDYREIETLLRRFADATSGMGKISISLPSMRLDSFNINVAEMIQSGRKTGLTFAPEAGSQKLRNIINKNITEKDMLDCLEIAFSKGWEKVKLYFMVGLPHETEDDVIQIARLLDKIIEAAGKHLPKKKFHHFKINASINAFCPKPFTPFQWVPQDSIESLNKKFSIIKRSVSRRYVDISWSDPERSIVECALSRGDRRVGKVIKTAWENGARFDNWSDFFNYDIWKESFKNNNIDIDLYTRRRYGTGDVLPWDIIDMGVKKGFLLKEYEKSGRFN